MSHREEVNLQGRGKVGQKKKLDEERGGGQVNLLYLVCGGASTRQIEPGKRVMLGPRQQVTSFSALTNSGYGLEVQETFFRAPRGSRVSQRVRKRCEKERPACRSGKTEKKRRNEH